MYSTRIFMPVLPRSGNTFYTKGYVVPVAENKVDIYFTQYSKEKHLLTNSQDDEIIFGITEQNFETNAYNNFIAFNQYPEFKLLFYKLSGSILNVFNDTVVILYDLEKIKQSQIMDDQWYTESHFATLQKIILKDDGVVVDKSSDCVECSPCPWLTCSMFVQHLASYKNLLRWLFTSILKDGNIQIKQANLICAIIIDLVLGYIILTIFIADNDISGVLMASLEKLVNYLYSLLKWLMGAPAGLKLNHAFNTMLGKYFSYNIELWWLFLDFIGAKLDVILDVYKFLGYFGFTLQAAMLCDIISIATFHSYCIYVYTARLFNMQISGLIALTRLFVGRKYNPLRKCVDSCEYSNQQLFVGTVAFTILLLLLPTTTMYYVVFAMFRVLLLCALQAAARLVRAVQCAPLAVAALWLVGSPRAAGKILLDVVNTEQNTPLVMKVRVLPKDLGVLVKDFMPPVQALNSEEWTDLSFNLLRGNLI